LSPKKKVFILTVERDVFLWLNKFHWMAQGVFKYTFLNLMQIVFHSYVMVTIMSVTVDITDNFKTVIQD